MPEIPKHVFCCERLHKCKFQGFALYHGLAWGEIEGSVREWREAHKRACGGKLIQFDLVESKGYENGKR